MRRAGVGVLLALVIGIKTPSAWVFAPGLLLIRQGLGAMLTPSVNIVQSSFAEEQQGEISGLSRSVSNLGSCLGTAIAGTILVAGITSTPEHSYGLAMVALAVVGLVGLAASVFLPAVLARLPPPGRRSRTCPGRSGRSKPPRGQRLNRRPVRVRPVSGACQEMMGTRRQAWCRGPQCRVHLPLGPFW